MHTGDENNKLNPRINKSFYLTFHTFIYLKFHTSMFFTNGLKEILIVLHYMTKYSFFVMGVVIVHSFSKSAIKFFVENFPTMF